MNLRGFISQLAITLRLYFRNRMALVYGYIFPLIFLITFWVLYRYDRVPLVRHMGELLTVAVLGGACFGLPTSMVSDRERGVWRRYRLAPASTMGLVTATIVARYLILVSAALLQLALAMSLGMPMPRHPAELAIAFTFVAFAFLGLGLVIAMLADNVPAVQALGQCIFLPMLVIGGIAVRLDALPEWAQHVSAFFPGRYAVAAIQASVTGPGLRTVVPAVVSLAMIGVAGCLAASRMFRWDSSQRFMRSEGRGWVTVALAAWIAAGVMSEVRGGVVSRVLTSSDDQTVDLSEIVPSARVPDVATAPLASPDNANAGEATAATPPSHGIERAPAAGAQNADVRRPDGSSPSRARTDDGARKGGASSDGAGVARSPDADASGQPADRTAASRRSDERRAANAALPSPATGGPTPGADARSTSPSSAPARAASAEPQPVGPPRWQDVTLATIEHDILFDRLPPDGGIVTPIAPAGEPVDPDLYDELDRIASAIASWPPGLVSDPVQKVRNLLYIAAVPDVFQMPTERFIPSIVYTQIQQVVPRETLIKVLYWIAVHPDEGDDSATTQLQPFGLGDGANDIAETRGRAAVYAVKLLGRLTGKRPGR